MLPVQWVYLEQDLLDFGLNVIETDCMTDIKRKTIDQNLPFCVCTHIITKVTHKNNVILTERQSK